MQPYKTNLKCQTQCSSSWCCLWNMNLSTFNKNHYTLNSNLQLKSNESWTFDWYHIWMRKFRFQYYYLILVQTPNCELLPKKRLMAFINSFLNKLKLFLLEKLLIQNLLLVMLVCSQTFFIVLLKQLDDIYSCEWKTVEG